MKTQVKEHATSKIYKCNDCLQKKASLHAPNAHIASCCVQIALYKVRVPIVNDH